MSEWVRAALGDLISVKHGFAFAGSEFSTNSEMPTLVTPGNFAIGGGFTHAKIKTFSGSVPAEYLLAPRSVVVTMTDLSKQGDTLGYSAKIPQSGRYLHNQRIGLVETRKPEKLSVDYAYYLLQTPRYRQHILASATGSTVRHTSPSRIYDYKFGLPPLDEQRRIAEVLGALDDLIETNVRLANKLWTAAELSFARCQSERGARVSLGSLIELKYGKALPADVRRPGHVPVVSSAGISGSHDIALVEGPGVVVGRKGSVGSVTWVGSDFFPIDTAFYVKTLEVPLIWAYFVLKSLPLESMNTDSAVPGLNRSNALALEVARPAESILSEFNRQACALIESAGRLHEEIQQLRRTRDELLPLLMSGKVRVRPEEVSA